MRSSERIVERVFKALLPEAELIYRTSQPTGEYDFHLRCRNGELAALEVTELLDERWMKTQAAIHGKRVGGNVIKCRECKKTWLLIPINGADIPKIRREADRLFAELERDGIRKIDSLRAHLNPRISKLCNELQITGASVIEDVGAKILIGSVIRGGTVTENSAIRAAEEIAAKPDIVEKPRQSQPKTAASSRPHRR